MKSTVFYLGPLTGNVVGPYQVIYDQNDRKFYIRAETVEGNELLALNIATPAEGEIVLNSVLLP